MKISSGAIARTICLLLALANQALAVAGREIIPVAEEDVYQLCSLVFTIVSALAAWWKNNSFTKAATEADELMNNKN